MIFSSYRECGELREELESAQCRVEEQVIAIAICHTGRAGDSFYCHLPYWGCRWDSVYCYSDTGGAGDSV